MFNYSDNSSKDSDFMEIAEGMIELIETVSSIETCWI